MFGIIMAVVSTGVGIIDGIKRSSENSEAIKRGRQRQLDGTDNTNTYFDVDGVRRDLKTHQIRNVDFAIVENDGQDRCIRDKYGNVVRNLTEEKRLDRASEARVNGRTVFLYREHGNGIYNGREHREFGGDGYCEGQQYKDLTNGKIYVGRSFGFGVRKEDFEVIPFYMDLNGFLVREADSWKLKRKRGEAKTSEEDIAKFIMEFNNNQGKTRPKPSLDNFGKPNYNDAMYTYELKKFYRNNFNCVKEV